MATQPILEEQIDAAYAEAIKAPEAPAGDAPKDEPQSPPEPSTEPKTTPDEPPAEAPDREAAEPELLSREEEAVLLKNPVTAKALKQMKSALTKKTMALAEERKALEPLQRFQEQLQGDPKATLKAVADHYGIRLDEPAPVKAQAEGTEDPQAILLKALMPMPDETPEQGAARLTQAIEKVSQLSAQKALAPLQEKQQQLLQDQVERETKGILEQFEKKHPDFKKHEAAMSKIMQQIQPNGMGEIEFLETAYKLATYDLRDADKTQEIVKKLNKSASQVDTSTPGVSPQRVSKAAPKFASVDEAIDRAMEDAAQGITYESE